MWVFSVVGAFSVVKSGRNDRDWMVRARHERDLLNLKRLCGLRNRVLTSQDTDYPFRLIVNHAQVFRVLACLGETVDYANFKSAVAKRPDQANKVHAYHRIWDALLETQVVRSLFSHWRDGDHAEPRLPLGDVRGGYRLADALGDGGRGRDLVPLGECLDQSFGRVDGEDDEARLIAEDDAFWDEVADDPFAGTSYR